MLTGQLRADLTAAMRSQDAVRTATLRMALAAVKEAEVAGKVAKALTDEETLKVLGAQAKRRKESAEAFAAAGRPELAANELAELAVLEDYLPSQLDDEELGAIVVAALAEGGFTGREHMGPAMKAANAAVAGRADGGRVAALVRAGLGL